MLLLSIIIAGLDSLGIVMFFPLLNIFIEGVEPTDINFVFSETIRNFLAISAFDVRYLIILLVSIFALKSFILYCSALYAVSVRAFLLKIMKSKIYRNNSELSFTALSTKNTGEQINIITEQVNKSLGLFTNYQKMIATFALAVVPMTTALILQPVTGTVSILLFMFLGLFFQKLNRKIRTLSSSLLAANTTLSSTILQNYQNLKYLRTTGALTSASSNVDKNLLITVELQKQIGRLQAIITSFREVIIILALIVLIFVHLNILGGSISELMVVLFLLYRGFNAFINTFMLTQKVVENIAPLKLVRSESENVYTNKNMKKKKQLQQVSGFKRILVENLFCRLPEAHKFLFEGVNIELCSHTTYCFVGELGSGKTTLIDCILGFVPPSKGNVNFEFIDGVRSGVLSDFLKIGYITQEPILLDASIKENILLYHDEFDDSATDEHIVQTLKKCGLEKFLSSIDYNLDFEIGERGSKLSGGIRQRLLIARELFRNPDILILDEATSALDDQSETLVKSTLENINGSCMIIIITHRPKLLELSDVTYKVIDGNLIQERS